MHMPHVHPWVQFDASLSRFPCWLLLQIHPDNTVEVLNHQHDSERPKTPEMKAAEPDPTFEGPLGTAGDHQVVHYTDSDTEECLDTESSVEGYSGTVAAPRTFNRNSTCVWGSYSGYGGKTQPLTFQGRLRKILWDVAMPQTGIVQRFKVCSTRVCLSPFFVGGKQSCFPHDAVRIQKMKQFYIIIASARHIS